MINNIRLAMRENNTQTDNNARGNNTNHNLNNNIKMIQIGILPKTSKESSSICCCVSNTTLSQEEKNLLICLKEQSKWQFDDNDNNHINSLNSLFEKSVKLFRENNSDKEITWRDIGFQSDQPSKDFRAAGVLSLFFIDYFITHYKNHYYNAMTLPYFPFALVAIKLTFLNQIFFRLFNENEQRALAQCYKQFKSTKKQTKVFCQLLKMNSEALFILQSKAMMYLINKYSSKVDLRQQELNYLIIDPLVNSAIKRTSRILTQLANLKEANFELITNMNFKIKFEVNGN